MTEPIQAVVASPSPVGAVVPTVQVVKVPIGFQGPAGPQGPQGPPGVSADQAAIDEHVNAVEPHPAYDNGPSLSLLYANAKV